MAGLEEKMEQVSSKAAEVLPDDALSVMEDHTQGLRERGVAGEAIGVGDRAPEFTLGSAAGDEVSLEGALARGPVILSFYRGRW